jgi:hypothetical protein
VQWHCEICQTPALVSKEKAARMGTRCVRCRNIDVWQVKLWIAQYQKNPNWNLIGLSWGYSSNETHMLISKVYYYLVQSGNDALLDQFWPDGVPHWLAERYPRTVEPEAA